MPPMAFPTPKNPDINQLSPVKGRFLNALLMSEFGAKKREKKIPTDVLTAMVVGALKSLESKEGSTLQDIKRTLLSGDYINKDTDLRPAVVMGLKKGFLGRSPKAVKAGIYGRYIAVTTSKKTGKPIPQKKQGKNRTYTLKKSRNAISKFGKYRLGRKRS